jgi:hypothetical protein
MVMPPPLLTERQLFRNASELLQCGLEVLDNLRGDLGRRRKVRCILEAVVLEPEEIEVQLIHGPSSHRS